MRATLKVLREGSARRRERRALLHATLGNLGNDLP